MEPVESIREYKSLIFELLSTREEIMDSMETQCAELRNMVIKLEAGLHSDSTPYHQVLQTLELVKETARHCNGLYKVISDLLTKEQGLIRKDFQSVKF